MRNTALLFAFCLPLWVLAQTDSNYFQQEVNMDIQVRLDDEKHLLHGFVSMEYNNHSPHALTEIYMHLWPNAYADKHTALNEQLLGNRNPVLHYASESMRGGMDSLSFEVDGVPVFLELVNGQLDVGRIQLNDTLWPGQSINISSPFRVKIPSGRISRLGHIGQSYQITQWYPKPAVYDAEGWHPMPYLTQGEFYSEFGTFTVQIEVPKNYVVAATGVLQNNNEREWLINKVSQTRKIKKEFPHWDSAKRRAWMIEQAKTPESSADYKTLVFTQDKVHDFAWFADKTYLVLQESFLGRDSSAIEAWSYFTPLNTPLWLEANTYLKRSTLFYSEHLGPYPYSRVQAVDGTISAGGGMEYPTITVIGNTATARGLDEVITHEVGHNWFYGILANNEREEPWMDEGLNSFYEAMYMKRYYDPAPALGGLASSSLAKLFEVNNLNQKDAEKLAILSIERMGQDQAINEKSQNFTSINYGLMVYGKSALALQYLEAYLGPRRFQQAMQNYYQTYKFKHPKASDFQNFLEQETKQSLAWFFEGLIGTDLPLDYSIQEVQACETRVAVRVKNKGKVAGPFSLTGIKKDGSPSATIWYNGFYGERTVEYLVDEYESIQLDYGKVMPEYNRKDNQYQIKGLLKKVEPLDLQFLISPEIPEKSQLFFSPIVKWNNYNKLILGTQLYNTTLPYKHFEFKFSPEISTYNGDIAGTGFMKYRWIHHSGLLAQTTFGLYGKSYDYQKDLRFRRYSLGANIQLRKNNRRSPHNHFLKYRQVYVHKALNPELGPSSEEYRVHVLRYQYENSHYLHPQWAEAGAQYGPQQGFYKYHLSYTLGIRTPRKSLVRSRTFVGIMRGNTDPDFQYQLDGRNDYLFDHYFLGRSENSGLLSRQFFEDEGGFKLETPGQRGTAVLAQNLQLPVYKSFGLFADAAYLQGAGAQEFLFDYGVQWVPIRDFFELFVGINAAGNPSFRYVLNMDLEDMIHALTRGRL